MVMFHFFFWMVQSDGGAPSSAAPTAAAPSSAVTAASAAGGSDDEDDDEPFDMDEYEQSGKLQDEDPVIWSQCWNWLDVLDKVIFILFWRSGSAKFNQNINFVSRVTTTENFLNYFF